MKTASFPVPDPAFPPPRMGLQMAQPAKKTPPAYLVPMTVAVNSTIRTLSS